MRRNGQHKRLPLGPAAIVAQWREEASILKRRGAAAQADVLLVCADELAAWAKTHELEALTLEQAVGESGYSYSALQHMVADGKLKNVGGHHAPRIRRSDLPRRVLPAAPSGPQLADRVLGARHRKAVRT